MKLRAPRLASAAAAICAVFLIVSAGALFTLQTQWFKDKVRREIVGAVEQATGGRIELRSFDYHWQTLTAEFQDFVVHGTERDSAAPLFHASSMRVELKIISVFKRNIDLASIVVRGPQFNLIVGPDGGTNIPVPPAGPTSLTAKVDALLNLKVHHFEFDDGLFRIGLRRIPLDARGEDTFLLLTYDRSGKRYDVKFSSRELHINSNPLRPYSGNMNATAQLERDGLSIQSAVFQSGESSVRASGTLQHFEQPVIDLRLSASVDATDVAAITKFERIGGGHFSVEGSGHYDENTLYRFQGKMTGTDVAYRLQHVEFRKINFESDVLVRPQDVELTHLVVAALGSTLSGQLAFKHGRDLQLEGNLAGLAVGKAVAQFSKQKLSWSGVAGGPFQMRAVLSGGWRDLAVQSNLSIVPGAGGIPLSGALDANYRMSGSVVEFGKSYLRVPHTQLTFSGTLGADLNVVLDSTDLNDLTPVLQLIKSPRSQVTLPALLQNGSAHFNGRVAGALNDPQFAGGLALEHFEARGQIWDQLRVRVAASANAMELASFVLTQGSLHASGDGRVGLQNWTVTNNSALSARARFDGADMVKVADAFSGMKALLIRGIAAGTVDLRGTVIRPQGTAQLAVSNVDAFGEKLNEVQVAATLEGETLQITRGHMQAGPAALSFSGDYRHTPRSWEEGQLDLKIDSNGFPLASLAPVHDYQPGLNARFEIHGQVALRVSPDRIEPLSANGTAVLREITVNNVPYGSLTLNAGTHGQTLTSEFFGDLRGSRLSGSAQMQLTADNPVVGEVHVEQLQLSTIAAMIGSPSSNPRLQGFLQGGFTFEGPLQRLDRMHGTISLQQLQLSPNVAGPSRPSPTDVIFCNTTPMVLQYANGIATVSNFQIGGKGTILTANGSIPLLPRRPVNLKVSGSAGLQILRLFYSNMQSSGESSVNASIEGTLLNPIVNGTLDLKNGAFAVSSVTNGLTAVNGRVRFDRDRATIERLTAQTGGGELSVGGFISFGKGGPLVYRLEANAEDVRVRYGGSVSVTATSQFRLTGTSESSILSGTATVSRVIFNPNTDIGNLLTSAAAPVASPSNEKEFLTGMQFDIHVESAPNLQLSTELSRDVEAEIDLRLRGTPEKPILLGNITANQGDIRVFGTKYSINRGEVSFVNAVKIEPVLDMDLQTQARGITVDITISGAPGKLNINYRSDPPLQPRDIIALLTVGRAPDIASNVPNAQVTNDVSALQSGANTVLGQAISPVSNRLSKLFGITNIKIDPLVQGITNTPQARLTVEQQISRQITVTYVTNLSQTSEQIFRLEWAFSPQYSLVALRDDNGEFGIDIQYRKRFK